MRCAGLVGAVMLVAGLAVQSGAQAQRCVLDAQASHVGITLKTNHDIVHGTFRLQSGLIDLDRAEHRLAGTITIDASSGKTGNDTRDQKMTTSILNAPQFAAVTFEPRSFTGTLSPQGSAMVQVTGIFTLLGQPHELTAPMLVSLSGDRCTAKGTLVLPYVAWGLKKPDFLFWKADKDVTVDLDLAGHLASRDERKTP